MKKRLMFLIESMIVGGAERVLINLVNNLNPEIYDITVISVFKQSVYENYHYTFIDSLASFVKYKYLVDNSNPLKYKAFNWAFYHGSRRLLHHLLIGGNYDVEVAWYEGLPTSFLAHSSNTHSRKLAWLHYGDGFAHLTVAKQNANLRDYRQYDTIVGVSDGICHIFQERVSKDFPLVTCYNVLNDKDILCKANAFDVERDEVLTFVSVGRLTPVKGFDRLVDACARLKQEGFCFRLWLVGEGSERLALQNQIQRFGLERDVKMLGNQDNPYPYMKSADWLVSSSLAEGFSTVLAEACIIGTPIISTRCVGTAELLGNNSEYGLMTDNSEASLYQAMKRVIIHPELCAEYTVKIQRRSALFKKEALVDAVAKILT
jgi:glycosyltransferase involved in cell wall biosynthesis